MTVGRWCVAFACLGLAVPAAAQQTDNPNIIVNGSTDKQKVKVTWKRAESDHVVIFSKGSDAELVRVSRNLERLYQLMSRFYRRGDTTDPTVKLQVTLVDSASDFRAMELANLRGRVGPYVDAFTDPIYYDPREDGPVLAIARSDQNVDLNTNRAYNLDCDDAIDDGATECTGNVPYHPPLVWLWEKRLYAAFARHFLLTYTPAVYPRWYVDGIGALFSTISVRGDGAVKYAEPPENYQLVLRAYGYAKVSDVLAGRTLDVAPGKTGWNPYEAWLITHYFVFSPLKPERSRQFRAYMTAIQQGKPLAEAVAVFGSPTALDRDVLGYVESNKSFGRAAPQAAIEAPLITPLSPGAAALVEARVELGTQMAAANPDAMLRRDGWVARLRETVTKAPYDANASLLLAEAECRSTHADDCLADAERVLAVATDNDRALLWKGVALTDKAVAGPVTDRAATLAAARAALERSIALDSEAPASRVALFQSYTKVDERVPEAVMTGMAQVIRAVPAAPAPRLYLAQELQRQGKTDLARRLVQILLYGAYDSPERAAARALFANNGAPTAVAQ